MEVRPEDLDADADQYQPAGEFPLFPILEPIKLYQIHHPECRCITHGGAQNHVVLTAVAIMFDLRRKGGDSTPTAMASVLVAIAVVTSSQKNRVDGAALHLHIIRATKTLNTVSCPPMNISSTNAIPVVPFRTNRLANNAAFPVPIMASACRVSLQAPKNKAGSAQRFRKFPGLWSGGTFTGLMQQMRIHRHTANAVRRTVRKAADIHDNILTGIHKTQSSPCKHANMNNKPRWFSRLRRRHSD